MENTFVSIFDNVWKNASTSEISVLDIIWKISNGEWKDKIEAYRLETDKEKKEFLKKSLPGVVFAGQITASSRLDSHVKNYTGIVVADIDKIPKGKLKTYKKSLMQDSRVLAFFESPSMGLKVLFKVDSGIKEHKRFAFKQIERYCLYHHDIVIDPSGKNPARLCFVSYDPDMYFNEFCDDFEVDLTLDIEEEERRAKLAQMNYSKPSPENICYDSDFVFETCMKFVKNSSVGSYHKGNRNNYVFGLACCLNRASMQADQAIQMIATRYQSLTIEEITTTVMSAYKHNSNEFGTYPIYRDFGSKQDKLF